MSKQDFRIVFMGTPDFAAGILDGLVKNGFNVTAAVTATDKPAGRGQQLSESAVKKYCTEHSIPILQPISLKDENFLNELKALEADLFVVVAFRMLPEVVWNMPPQGTINLHASLLPQYRGAAPINWAIVNGEKETGVTTFFIEKEIDTGMVIERSKTDIGENETAGELHDRLMILGSSLINKSVQQIREGSVKRTPQVVLEQEETELRAAPKIFKPMCAVNWEQDVQTIHNFCRGFSPYPTAWTTFYNKGKGEKKSIKLFATQKTDIQAISGGSLRYEKGMLLIPCSDYYLAVLELQPEGKRRMTAKEFAAGHLPEEWTVAE